MIQRLPKIVQFGLIIATVAVLVACQQGPGSNGIPNVEGTYTGPMTILFSDRGTSFEGSARLVVEQSGTDVTLSGSLTLADVTVNITAVSGVVTSTGSFVATRSGVIDAEAALESSLCGRARPVSASLAFSGNTVRFEESADTEYCGRVSLHATLKR